MKKIVDGKEIDLTPEDLAEKSVIESKWLEEKAAKVAADTEKNVTFQRSVLLQQALIAMVIERAAQANPPQAVTDAADYVQGK